MKNLKFALFFLCGFMIFSCTETADEINHNAKEVNTPDMPLFSQDDLIEIGYFEGEEFQFSVSEDELNQVYTYNVELNLDETGTLDFGEVVPADEESEEYEYFVLLVGSLGEEGSATLSNEVITKEDEASGLVYAYVRAKPVLPGICYNIDCSQCRKADLTPTNLNCRCQSNFNLRCPYVIDPTIVWTQ